MRKLQFYFLVMVLGVVNSFLLSQPNLIGKLGIILYKHHYLRDFPRTLLTVTVVVGTGCLLSEGVQLTAIRRYMGRSTAAALLYGLLALSFVLLVYVAFMFSRGTYSHTGIRFGLGALLLPALLILVFVYGALKLGADRPPFPESPASKVPANENQPLHDDRSNPS